MNQTVKTILIILVTLAVVWVGLTVLSALGTQVPR